LDTISHTNVVSRFRRHNSSPSSPFSFATCTACVKFSIPYRDAMQKREETTEFGSFVRRHIGPSQEEVRAMLHQLGFENLQALIDATVPKNIRLDRQLRLPKAKSETEAIAELRAIAGKNKIVRSFIGAGYYDCITPPVIQRNILENPGWYTAYTPYQA